MNRCPNHKCRQICDVKHSFCRSCGIAVTVCPKCRREGRISINRADGFYCRHCGSVLTPPPRLQQSQTEFGRDKINFLSPSPRMSLNERSDSFPMAFSQSHLWLLTTNNKLKIVENRADALLLDKAFISKQALDELQNLIIYLEPQTAPVVFRDRLVLFGSRKMLSFSIHPNMSMSRRLQDLREIEFPQQWRPVFNGEAAWRGNNIELPITLAAGGFALISISMECVMGALSIESQPMSQPASALPIGVIDGQGVYFWAKDLKSGFGSILYCKRQNTDLQAGAELQPIDAPPLLFLARPVMFGDGIYAITAENRLIELKVQRNTVMRQRRFGQAEQGARAIFATRESIIVAVHENLVFYDFQTGELRAVAADIDATHLFTDSRGTLLAVNRSGRLIMMNPADPLERWGDEDTTSDDSRVFDAFLANNSLYSLSENGEVCRFDLN